MLVPPQRKPGLGFMSSTFLYRSTNLADVKSLSSNNTHYLQCMASSCHLRCSRPKSGRKFVMQGFKLHVDVQYNHTHLFFMEHCIWILRRTSDWRYLTMRLYSLASHNLNWMLNEGTANSWNTLNWVLKHISVKHFIEMLHKNHSELLAQYCGSFLRP
jgi:hypothetical protein